MRNLILLTVVCIILDHVGFLINYIIIINPKITISLSDLPDAFGFMFALLFWYWIMLYSGWIIANRLLVFFFDHSVARSVAAGALLPVIYLFLPTTWFLAIWHLLMGAAFAYFFHKYVYTDS